jgi:hypothetical protein
MGGLAIIHKTNGRRLPIRLAPADAARIRATIGPGPSLQHTTRSRMIYLIRAFLQLKGLAQRKSRADAEPTPIADSSPAPHATDQQNGAPATTPVQRQSPTRKQETEQAAKTFQCVPPDSDNVDATLSARRQHRDHVPAASIPYDCLPPARLLPADHARRFLRWLQGTRWAGRSDIYKCEIEWAYRDFCETERICPLNWRAVAPHFNQLIQVPGGPLKPTTRRLDPKTGQLGPRVRVYRIPPRSEQGVVQLPTRRGKRR